MVNPLLFLRVSGCLVALALGQAANAQMVITSRNSTVRYAYVHGGGADVHQADVTLEETDLVPSDTTQTSGSDAAQGVWNSQAWTTSVDWDVQQAYAMVGPVSHASRIVVVAATDLAATAAGPIATASVQSVNPGNSAIFEFHVSQPADYRLVGSLVGSTAFSYVALQRFNGFNWEYVFYSGFQSGTDIAWDDAGTLIPGSPYRLTAVLDLGVGMNLSAHKDLFMDLRVGAQPETVPVSAVTLIEGESPDGGLAELSTSDDAYYCAFNDPETLACKIQFDGTTAILSPSELVFDVEYHVGRGGLACGVLLYRFSTGTFVVQAGSVASTTDASLSATVQASAPAYVGSGGELRAQLRFAPINDEAPAFDGWQHCVDLAQWTVTP